MKGTQRRIIFLKSTKSKRFDEAYFVLKDDLINDDEDEILKEAEKILFSAEGCKKKREKKRLSFKGAFLFSLGLFCGVVLTIMPVIFLL
ncbi:MAG: hypothetical protein J6C61_05245 [Clostridia bacterium]|nr:hypothetical protein [Clostridia bacterium]